MSAQIQHKNQLRKSLMDKFYGRNYEKFLVKIIAVKIDSKRLTQPVNVRVASFDPEWPSPLKELRIFHFIRYYSAHANINTNTNSIIEYSTSYCI